MVNLALHNVTRVTASASHADKAHWVDLVCELRSPVSVEPFTVTLFFREPWMADALAAGINATRFETTSAPQATNANLGDTPTSGKAPARRGGADVVH